MNTLDAPLEYSCKHPLEQLFRPIVATHSIERFADATNSALDAHYSGIGVYGFARFGKSEAINYLIYHPEWLNERVATFFRMDAPDGHKRSDTLFFRVCMTLLGLRIPARATPTELAEMVAGRMIEMCQNAGTHLIIVFIDDAQKLVPSDYENLVTVDNRLTQKRYYLFVAFVHQRDITGFSNETIGTEIHPPHVTGRFLVRKHEFTGLCNAEDAAYVLSRYDECTEWPPGSAISFTQHFAARAFADGFRLSHYAARLWAQASNLRAQARLPESWTWPMKSFEVTVVHLLTAIATRTPQFCEFTEDNLVEALHASGLIELELSRHTYKPKELP